MKFYIQDRCLCVRLSWRNVMNGIALIGLSMAFIMLSLYQRPAWQYKIVKTTIHVLDHFELIEYFGLMERLYLSPDFILNRRGLNLAGNESLSGKKPVNMPMSFQVTLDGLGESFVRHFRRSDKNEDGQLSPMEFQVALEQMKPIKFGNPKVDDTSHSSKSYTELSCEFQPLLLSTLTKELTPGIGTNLHYLDGLYKWQKPHATYRNISTELLIKTFVSPNWDNVTVGKVFYLVKPQDESSNSGLLILDHPKNLHLEVSNRYFPPSYSVSDGVQLFTLQSLLSMFHKRAFVSTRHPPYGSTAVVRAVSDNAVDIAFRIHGEFQLNFPPSHPLWFTPSYFYGHIVFDRKLSKVLDFEINIPYDRKLNVDMEWLQIPFNGSPDETEVEVDIGYCPLMRLKALKPSNIDQTWKTEISELKAFSLLEVELYPFKKVPYYSFPDAVSAARSEQKLLHTVVLWGSLDDQSC